MVDRDDGAVTIRPLAHTARRPSSASSGGIATMGKYVLGWFLGVPVIVLVIVYFIFN
jgi:hypothetical protein